MRQPSSWRKLGLGIALGLSLMGTAQAKEGVGPRESESTVKAVLTEEQRKEVDYKLRAAQEFSERGYLDAAVVELLGVLKTDPANVKASDMLTKVLVRTGNWALTIKTLQNLLELEPKNPRYPRLLVQVSQAYDMPLQECAALEKLTEIEPDNAENWERLGNLYTRLYRPADTVKAYQKASALKPQDAALLKKLAESYQGTGEIKARLDATERLAALEPNEANRNALARLSLDSDSPRRALDLYEKLAADYPNDPDYKQAVALSLFEIGNSYYDHELYCKALDYYDLAEQRKLEDDRLEGARRKAHKMMHPSISGNVETGNTGRNDLQYYDAGVHFTIPETSLTLGAVESWRNATDPGLGTTGSLQLTRVVGTYRLWRDWHINGMFGTSPKGNVGSLAVDFIDGGLQAAIGYNHEFVYETPLSINTGLNYDEFYGTVQYAIDPRWYVSGQIHTYTFSNSNSALLTDLGVGYSPIIDPDHYALTVRLIRSDFHNAFEENQFLRFGPKFLGQTSLGLGWQQRVSENFRYNLEYLSSWTNDGSQLNSYRAGIDYNIGLGSDLFLQYEYGASARGVINPGSFNGRDDQRFSAGIHFTF